MQKVPSRQLKNSSNVLVLVKAYELTSPKYQECKTIPTLSGKLWKESHTRALYWLIDGYLRFNKIKETPFQIKSNLFHQDSSYSNVTAGMRMINSISEREKKYKKKPLVCEIITQLTRCIDPHYHFFFFYILVQKVIS